MARLEIEHALPVARGGGDDEGNLWLVFSICNGHQANMTEATDPESGTVVALFNPCLQRWFEHIRRSDARRCSRSI
jgi:hypothetical protein